MTMTFQYGAPNAAVIYQFALSPYDDWQHLAWAGALIITLFVLGLNILARTVFRQEQVQR